MGSKKNKKSKRGIEESPPTPRRTEILQKPPQTPENNPTPRIPIRSPYTPRPNRPQVLPTISPIVPAEDILQPNVRKWLKGERLERLEPAYNAYKREKRNFSQLSSTSLESSSGQRQTDIKQDMDNESNIKYYLQVVQQKLKVADAAYEAKQATIRELRAGWQDGSLEITHGQFKEETKRLEEDIGALLVERVHIRASKNQLAAKELDTENWNKLAHAEDWAYIDLLASRLKEPSESTLTMKNTRNPEKQARWRRAIMKAYNAENESKTSIWCPIAQRHEYAQSVTAAHIVRYNVSEPAAVHLFGPIDDSDGHIWSIRNGIPLHCEYEQMLDDGKIAIVPTKDGKDLMVVVLDETERAKTPDPHDAIPRGQALHGRTLVFLNDHRPAMRYLYFCFAMNILRRQKFEVDGWWKDRIVYADTSFFPTPGKWVCETTLRKLAIRIGHLPIDDVDGFVAMTKGRKLEDPFQEGTEAVDKEGKDDEKEELFTSYLQYTYQDSRSIVPELD